jgi:Cof subfamily protein (haloacid dehalogenase superfamily)
VLLATGRMFQSVRPYARAAAIEDPVICYQGAAVAEPVSGRFLLHEPIPLQAAREVIESVEAEGLPLNVYVGDELYVARENEEALRYARFQNLAVHEVGDLLGWLSEPPTKLVTIGDPELLDQVEARMKSRFEGRLSIAKSLPFFLEFAKQGVTKGSGLAFVAERLGFSLARTVAFGDGENDLELLEAAGYGVAVAEAHERLFAVADLVCPGPEEEGVAQVIEAMLGEAA